MIFHQTEKYFGILHFGCCFGHFVKKKRSWEEAKDSGAAAKLSA